jgi:hypothetical protein
MGVTNQTRRDHQADRSPLSFFYDCFDATSSLCLTRRVFSATAARQVSHPVPENLYINVLQQESARHQRRSGNRESHHNSTGITTTTGNNFHRQQAGQYTLFCRRKSIVSWRNYDQTEGRPLDRFFLSCLWMAAMCSETQFCQTKTLSKLQRAIRAISVFPFYATATCFNVESVAGPL